MSEVIECALTGRKVRRGEWLYVVNPWWMPLRHFIRGTNYKTGEAINFPPIRWGDACQITDILGRCGKKLGWSYFIHQESTHE